MTKAELIDRIARSRDLPPDVTKKCIAEILDVAFAELSTYFVRTKITRKQTPRFTMPGFGTFTKKRRAPRKGVNPQTLEPMEIQGYDTLDFKPGTELKAALAEARAPKARGRSKASGRSRAATKTTARAAKKKSKTAPSRKAAARKSSSKRPAKVASKKSASRRAASLGGRRLKRREELEYVEFEELKLPDAPLQRSRARRRRKTDDSESTG